MSYAEMREALVPTLQEVHELAPKYGGAFSTRAHLFRKKLLARLRKPCTATELRHIILIMLEEGKL